jgi:hypothetical protein
MDGRRGAPPPVDMKKKSSIIRLALAMFAGWLLMVAIFATFILSYRLTFQPAQAFVDFLLPPAEASK